METKDKQDNQGFTLIEVILAMLVLAVISIPLLNYFSESMRYNTMMASKQRAVLLAQEVVENLKEQEMLLEDTGTGYTVPYLVNQHYQIASNTLTRSGTGEIQLMGKAEEIGKKYDVVVTAKAEKEASDTAKETYGMDNTTDVLAADGKQDEEALVYFKAVNRAYCEANEEAAQLTTEQIQAAVKRCILIHIAMDGTQYRVTVNYSYSCQGLKGDSSVDTVTKTVLAGSRVTELNSIYLMYHAFSASDCIEMSKEPGVMLSPDLYLACQNLEDTQPGYEVRVKNVSTAVVHTNVGTEGRTGTVVDDNTGFALQEGTNLRKLANESKKARLVTIEVAVYQKGDAGVSGKEPMITVAAAKGE